MFIFQGNLAMAMYLDEHSRRPMNVHDVDAVIFHYWHALTTSSSFGWLFWKLALWFSLFVRVEGRCYFLWLVHLQVS